MHSYEDRILAVKRRDAQVANHGRLLSCWRRFKTDHLCRLNIDQGLLLT